MPKRSANCGRVSYINYIPDALIRKGIAHNFDATDDFSRTAEADALIICVPTPLNKQREPDLSYVTTTANAVAPFLRRGQLVALESTTWPGTTEEVIQPIIEQRGFKIGRDVFLVFSPERQDPGNAKFDTQNIPKLVGGVTPACLAAGSALYAQAVDKVVPVSSTRVAEMAKLLENIHRAVNIGLVNELKMVCDRMGIDLFEVVDAAATKPFGFVPYYPGPGLGGHCIPIDPFYLTWKAREYGQNTKFIELAGEVNTAMPMYVVHRTQEALNAKKKSINGSKILIMGLAYKANVDDDRESPSYTLLDLFKERGAKMAYFDPHVPVVRPSREHGHWAGVKSVPWTAKSIGSYDAVIICTNHKKANNQELADWAQVIVDTRNAMADVKVKAGKVWKA